MQHGRAGPVDRDARDSSRSRVTARWDVPDSDSELGPEPSPSPPTSDPSPAVQLVREE
jgi:hypothetical protein